MIFKEVLRPPIWVLAFIYFLFLSIVLSVWAALDDRATLVTLVISTLALIWIAALLTAITGWDYFRKALPYLRGPK